MIVKPVVEPMDQFAALSFTLPEQEQASSNVQLGHYMTWSSDT